MKPLSTLRNILVHPKDKLDKLKTSGVVYGIPCQDCSAVYVGETGRPLNTRIKEHRKEVEDVNNHIRTRQESRELAGTFFKSAVTDHTVHEKHTIDWEGVHIKDRENNRFNRIVKESIHICKEKVTINRDTGGYKLPPVYKQLLKATTAPSSGRDFIRANCHFQTTSDEGASH